MDFYVSGEFGVVTLIYEENLNGGIRIYSFFGFWAWVHVSTLRRGDHCVFPRVFGGTFNVYWGGFCGLLTPYKVSVAYNV
jgi:hypothetical protein